jgi:hypothetical protein
MTGVARFIISVIQPVAVTAKDSWSAPVYSPAEILILPVTWVKG